ncbi:MAG: DUF4139 domain-containing protein [Alphaproteobacteria bacterium]|nr:DUF4139 domain-containing protein [Alphaproteobacteria bacterium]
MQKTPVLVLAMLLMTTTTYADITVKNDNNTDLALSIYNNTALVKDVRTVDLPTGKTSILFAGVSEQMRPETIIVNAEGVTVQEQNYNFAMLSPENVARANIGKVVKTILWDQEKAQNIYDKALILDVYAGRPVLKFSYGIEFDFPGRIIWEKLPENLQTEPSLSLGVETNQDGPKAIELMYLTGGLHWKANYVAEFMSDNELNLKSWVSINNTSGVDYNQARVQIVAGDANMTFPQTTARPMVMKAVSFAAMDNAATGSVAMPVEESVGEYHVYTLPEKITIANNQTKQVSLLSKNKIKYQKEYRLSSPLYLNVSNSGGEFKKQNSDVYIKLVNKTESNLGEPLPQGTMRFYDHDSKGNMLFVGEANLRQLAVGEEAEMRIGRSFDVSASGKVVSLQKITENTAEAELNITFNNAKPENVALIFDQYINHDWTILSENIKGTKYNAHTMRWNIDIPAQGTSELKVKVRMVKPNE